MEDSSCILFGILIIIGLYIIIEFLIINKNRKEVNKKFLELDSIFEKRMNILSKMVDIVKGYDRNQFDDLGSRLYDYIKSYSDFDCNKKIEINETLDCDIKKLLLVTKVYPELNDLSKYVKLEKQIIRYSKVIKKMKLRYNKMVDDYNYKRRIFPRRILCVIGRFYNYDYFRI